MVPPIGFKYNQETAVSNRYQKKVTDIDVSRQVLLEFNNMVNKLRQYGIEVILFKQQINLPDAVFPNNWFSTHVGLNGQTDVIIYPMLTANRQAEVNPLALKSVLTKSGIKIGSLTDLRNGSVGVLEGTGSMVLDRENKIIYASLSERTSKAMLKKAAAKMGSYKLVIFRSYDHAMPIYHTNVMMGLGQKFAVICLDCIKNSSERNNVTHQLKRTGKKIINITPSQVNHMCGNVLELINKYNQHLLVMSQNAFDHFTSEQKNLMKNYVQLLAVDINTIETVGGGSARCMMAEIFGSATNNFSRTKWSSFVS